MSIVIGGITCTRFKEYPKENFMNCFQTGSTVEDMILCPYADRMTVMKALLGYDSEGNPTCPMSYDGAGSDFKNLYVSSCGPVEPLGVDKTSTDPVTAKIPVQYSKWEIQVAEDGTYTEINVQSCSEFLTLTIGKEGNANPITWSDGVKLAETEAPAGLIEMEDIVYTKHNLTSIPSWVWTLPGKINSVALHISALNKTFAANTLLCRNPSFSRTIGLAGTLPYWTIAIHLTHKGEDWNKFPHFAAGGGEAAWEYVYSGGVATANIQKFYKSASFASIL